ncbi:MAG: L,D-transpeptidase family protein [Candidatus Falkowbacteria bacterium]
MKSLRLSLIVAFFVFFLAVPALAFPEDNLSSRLNGKILLDVDNNGEAWYVYPGDFHRYYLGTPEDAYSIMRNLSLGVSNDNFSKIVSSTPDRFKGLILLKPEDVGKAYYVNPSDKSLIYMADATGAFALMRQFSLGITNSDLKTIPIGKIVLDGSGKEISREWQYLGWWGDINANYVPVRSEPKNDSKKIGTFFIGNNVKVLAVKKGDGRIWYRIDGGQYPGAYIDSLFVSAIAQPIPEKKLVIPTKVKTGDYWMDVNISKKVLTLYKYDQVVMSTYISVGHKDTPTIIGTYNVWLKMKKTRMTGAPPLATHEYDLPDVPWVMYYKGSYSVHGTYWHDDFGSARSSGCTNVTQGDAKLLFDLTNPKIGNVNSIRPTVSNPGVVINNHY